MALKLEEVGAKAADTSAVTEAHAQLSQKIEKINEELEARLSQAMEEQAGARIAAAEGAIGDLQQQLEQTIARQAEANSADKLEAERLRAESLDAALGALRGELREVGDAGARSREELSARVTQGAHLRPPAPARPQPRCPGARAHAAGRRAAHVG